jgi:hypothetical protein
MAQTNVPGSQKIVTPDGREITRKVIVATGGLSAPGGPGSLTSVQITDLPGGLRQGVYEYTTAPSSGGGGSAEYDARVGGVVELLGGSREQAIETHPLFKDIPPADVAKIRAAAREPDESLLPDSGPGADAAGITLYELLSRGVETFLSPSVLARVSDIESSLPDLGGLCKIDSPRGISTPTGSVWLLTGVSARGIGNEYEVTREYTLTGDGAQIAATLYGG